MKFITFLFFIAGCATVVTADYTPKMSCISPIPAINLVDNKEALGMGVTVKTYDFSSSQNTKIHTAVQLVKTVIHTKEFRSAVLNFKWKGEKQFAHTALNNQGVYDFIIAGAEDFDIVGDNEMDLHFSIYKEDSDVIAYTRWGLPMIHFNEKYFHHNEVRMANTVMHEWLHKVGFRHPEKHSDEQSNSVPYAVGNIVQDIAANYYNFNCKQ